MNTALNLPRLFHATRTRADSDHVTLRPGCVLKLWFEQGDRISAKTGRVWLTEPRDLDDHFLSSNNSHLIKYGGWVIIECDSNVPANLQIER